MQVKNEDIVDKWAYYGLFFPAIIKKNNITAIQFHPEKSLDDGINLIKKLQEIKIFDTNQLMFTHLCIQKRRL